jgi:hypothetical protein
MVLPVAVLFLTTRTADAQRWCPPQPCPPTPCPSATVPGYPSLPGTTEQAMPRPGETTDMGAGMADTGAGAFGGLTAGAGVGSSVALASPGGYIDDAIPQTIFRIRDDAAFGFNRWDRATWMFGTWREGSFHAHAFVNDGTVKGTFFDTRAQGTQIISDRVNMDELSAYMEYAPTPKLSAFVLLPWRFMHFGPNLEDVGETPAERKQFPETAEVRGANADPQGFSDTVAGFKYAFIEDPGNRYATFQFRTYFPTGDPGLALGTGHYSLEPGILLYQRLSDRLVVQGEFMDWIPIDGGRGSGSVLTYGAGFGYDVFKRQNLTITPVVEVVGWTVLGGTESVDGTVPAPITMKNGVPGVAVDGAFVPPDHFFQSASGDTIVNVKLGVRTYFCEHSDLYMGWGHAVTGSRWYEDIFRLEYRYRF